MNVSFHGIKNAGAYFKKQNEAESVRRGNVNYIVPKGAQMNIHMELTNENGRDLDDFKHILKAYPNKYNPRSLNVAYQWLINPNNGEKMRLYSVNDNLLNINDITFDVFNKIFLLMKKISKMPSDELKVENSYLRTEEAKDAFRYYISEDGANAKKILDTAHSRDEVKDGAQALSKKFERALKEYIFS